jgi:hypothetical protein
MSGNSDQGTTATSLPLGQQALLLGVVAAAFLLWAVSSETPIPSGNENRDKARAFLKEQFPDREVSPHDSESPHDRLIASVAVVYELIRSGKAEVARRAIEFAAEQRFGYAAPYVIGRLGSGDPELERAAQDYLRTIAGRDYGPDAESWRAWWRDPPRKFLGVVSVGHTTLLIAMPATLALAGVVLMALGRMGRRFAAQLGPPLVVLAWMMMGGYAVGSMRLAGNPSTCTFGSSRITYYAVVGLEDARVGGTGYMILAFAVISIGMFALMFACAAVASGRPAQTAGVQADRAGDH